MAVSSTSPYFHVQVKQNSTRSIDVLSLLMLLLSVAAFLYIAVSKTNTIAIVCFGVMALLTLWWFFLLISRRQAFKYIYIVLLLVAVYWFMQGGKGIFMGLLLVLGAVLETQSKKKTFVHIDAEGVVINDFITRRYTWAGLQNVVLKDGLITVDSKNNKLFQKETTPDITAQNEAEINEFCKLRLAANS